MRVLTLIHLYPPHHVGGYEVACRGVMERFQERGHQVVVLTSDVRIPGTDESPSSHGVEVRRELKMWFDPDRFEALSPSLAARVARERTNQSALRKILREFRPDVASVWSMGYSSWALMRILEDEGVPLVLTLLDDWPIYAFAFDPWTRMFDRRRWARPAGRLLGLCTRLPSFRGASVNVASRMIAEQIETHGRWKFPSAPIVPLGVDTREIPVSPPARRPWGWHLVYVGRVVATKGVPTLIRALALLPPDTTLDIIGHGGAAELAAMRALADEVGAAHRVSFSRAERRDLPERIRRGDLLVFPSEWAEPFGIVPLEAMACGVPVIATGTGGSGEFLEDGENCLLFTPGDPSALAAAVCRMAADGDLRDRLVAGGAATAERLNMESYTDEIEKLHVQAAGRVVPS